MGVNDVLASELDVVRQRSLTLTDLSDDDLCRQHSPLMSPLVWDLAHVGNYEDQWLLRAVDDASVGRPELDELYDAFRHPRSTRSTLSILPPDAARKYIGAVRDQVLDVLDRMRLDDERPLLRDGFVYRMVIQHEHQHAETMLATRQLGGFPAPTLSNCPRNRAPRVRDSAGSSEVLLAGGEFTMGTSADPWAYDNERPAHPVVVEPFAIDTALVTNRDYLAFIDATDAEPPEFWRREPNGDWSVDRFGEQIALPLDEPVQHVNWHQADAYARWRGRRLPTEQEWEFAAQGATPESANLGQRHNGPTPVGTYPDSVSAHGVHQLLGDVWEWTSSDFEPYPGFASFPYREYSEVFFGPEYKVLRGGSWATHPLAVRVTFRNWDFPIRRQIFAGFRTARDA